MESVFHGPVCPHTSTKEVVELAGFSDASSGGYAGVICSRERFGSAHIHIMTNCNARKGFVC